MSNRTDEDVQHDLESLSREMDVAMAEIYLASARRRLHERGTAESVEAETAHYDALRRYGELDTRRDQLQSEARSLRPAIEF